ncbi:MAG TPA: hypothetical protein VF857_11265 [Spirochaetota bacterium]
MISCRSPLVRTGIIASGCISFLYAIVLVVSAILLSRLSMSISYHVTYQEVILFIGSFILYECGYFYYTRRFFCGGVGLPGGNRHPLLSFIISSAAIFLITFLIILSWKSDSIHGLILVSVISALSFIATIPLFVLHSLIAYSVLFRIISRSGREDGILSRTMSSIDSLPGKALQSFNYLSRYNLLHCAIVIYIPNVEELRSHYGKATVSLFNRQIAFLLLDRSRSFDLWSAQDNGKLYAAIIHIREEDELSATVNRIRHTLSSASSFLEQEGPHPSFRIRAIEIRPSADSIMSVDNYEEAVTRALSDIMALIETQREEMVIRNQ